MPNELCIWFWDERISDSQYCAYDPKFKGDACQGDSGGPLQVFRQDARLATVVGVASYGVKTCPSEAPDVYTKVAYYLDWIQSHVWPSETPMKYFDDKNVNNFNSGVFTVLIGENRTHRVFVENTFGWNI